MSVNTTEALKVAAQVELILPDGNQSAIVLFNEKPTLPKTILTDAQALEDDDARKRRHRSMKRIINRMVLKIKKERLYICSPSFIRFKILSISYNKTCKSKNFSGM